MPDTKYVYGQTRYGEAQHAAAFTPRRGAERNAVCGAKIVSAYGPAFPGSQGIQHPWKCEKCDRAIKAAS